VVKWLGVSSSRTENPYASEAAMRTVEINVSRKFGGCLLVIGLCVVAAALFSLQKPEKGEFGLQAIS
jgi:hypothetical protein